MFLELNVFLMISRRLAKSFFCNTFSTKTISFKGFLSKCDQVRSFLRIWSHLLKKSLMENFNFCVVFINKDVTTKSEIYSKLIIKIPKYVSDVFVLLIVNYPISMSSRMSIPDESPKVAILGAL